MKSPWLWVLGIVAAILIFSGEKHGDTSVAPQQPYYQSPPTYQPPAVPAYSPPVFMGYPCTSNCSGHEAGYQWAEENGIDDPDNCGGNSNSFIEGCQVYAEEQQSAAAEAADSE